MALVDKLGKYIEKLDRPNTNLKYGIDDVCGITNTKQLVLGTKANLIGRTFEKFTILAPREFIFNRRTSRNGERISLGYNTTDREWILTEDYCHFRVRKDKEDILDPDFLYLFFLEPEFDRYARFNSWGSATEFFNWEEIIETPVPILPISAQRKIVHDYRVITNRIEALQQENTILEAQEDNVFSAMCLTEASEEWDSGFFKQLIISNISGDWGTEEPEKNNSAQVKCVRGTDIPSVNIGITNEAPVRFILQKNYTTKTLVPNSLVIEISGGSPVQSTGRIALLTDDLIDKMGGNVICSNFCKAITVDDNYLYFFYLYWKHLYNSRRLFDYENSTIGLKNFDFVGFTEQEEIRIPPVDVAKKLNSIAGSIHKALVINGFEIEELLKLQAMVLPRIAL